jgi:hypothetical protein
VETTKPVQTIETPIGAAGSGSKGFGEGAAHFSHRRPPAYMYFSDNPPPPPLPGTHRVAYLSSHHALTPPPRSWPLTRFPTDSHRAYSRRRLARISWVRAQAPPPLTPSPPTVPIHSGRGAAPTQGRYRQR